MRSLRTACSTARRPTPGCASGCATGPEIEQRTRELVAAESQCCAFVDLELSRDGDDLVLDISGPDDAQPVINMFFAPEPA
jgi:hypothetical protein